MKRLTPIGIELSLSAEDPTRSMSVHHHRSRTQTLLSKRLDWLYP